MRFVSHVDLRVKFVGGGNFQKYSKSCESNPVAIAGGSRIIVSIEMTF